MIIIGCKVTKKSRAKQENDFLFCRDAVTWAKPELRKSREQNKEINFYFCRDAVTWAKPELRKKRKSQKQIWPFLAAIP